MNGEERVLADYLAHGGEPTGMIYMICEECGSNNLMMEFQYWVRRSPAVSYQVQVFRCFNCGCVTVATIEKKTIGWRE